MKDSTKKKFLLGMLATMLVFGMMVVGCSNGTTDDSKKVKIDMVEIVGDTFSMGNDSGDGREKPAHDVTVSSFYMGKYEVTQKQYEKIMGTNPSSKIGNNYPVERVHWYDAIEFCNKLSENAGLTPVYTIDKGTDDPGYFTPTTPSLQTVYDTRKWEVTFNTSANGYRLPTSAEWEYACRAGTPDPFYTGAALTQAQANYNNAKDGEGNGGTVPVGTYAPNPWGLYDMFGNVAEWCWDWFDDSARSWTSPSVYNPDKSEYYDDCSLGVTNPLGPETGYQRVSRGGAFSNTSTGRMTVTYPERSHQYRLGLNDVPYYEDLGFRVARSK